MWTNEEVLFSIEFKLMRIVERLFEYRVIKKCGIVQVVPTVYTDVHGKTIQSNQVRKLHLQISV